MMDITSLLMGAIVGAIIGAIILWIPYRSGQKLLAETQSELGEQQSKNNELQNTVASQQAAAYQVRQAALAQQKKFEDDFAEIGEQRSKFE